MEKQRLGEKGMAAIEKQMQQNPVQLGQIAEKKHQIQQALVKQERLEQDVFELNGQNRKLFNRLLHSWHKDRYLGNWLEKELMVVRHHERQIAYRLEKQKEELLQERQQLSDLENTLHEQHQLLARVKKEGEK
jgi:hypothetical protein